MIKISSSEVHERRYQVVFSKTHAEQILKDAVCAQLDLPTGAAGRRITWRIEWGETSIDSGLGKELQVIVKVTQDMGPEPMESPAP